MNSLRLIFTLLLSFPLFSVAGADSTSSESAGADISNNRNVESLKSKATRSSESCLFDLRLQFALCNPNNLPLCPEVDKSKLEDFGENGRTSNWHRCWGRYELTVKRDKSGWNTYVGEWENGRLSGYAMILKPNRGDFVPDYIDGPFCDGRRVTSHISESVKDDPFGRNAMASGKRYEKVDCAKLRAEEDAMRPLPGQQSEFDKNMAEQRDDANRRKQSFNERSKAGMDRIESMKRAQECVRAAKSIAEQQKCRDLIE